MLRNGRLAVSMGFCGRNGSRLSVWRCGKLLRGVSRERCPCAQHRSSRGDNNLGDVVVFIAEAGLAHCPLTASASRIVQLAVFSLDWCLSCSAVRRGFRENPQLGLPQGPRRGHITQLVLRSRAGSSSIRSRRAPIPLAAAKGARMKTFEATDVDPGRLPYTEPPPGTNTPVFIPPDNVDPEMIWHPRP